MCVEIVDLPSSPSCPGVLPASLGHGAETSCKVSRAVLKGTTDLVLRAELSPVRDVLPVFA